MSQSVQKGDSAKRGLFSGNLGFILATAASAVGLGNIWRFPYISAKYGGGTFLFVYMVLLLTFGLTLVVAETALGRRTRQSAIGAYKLFAINSGSSLVGLGGLINAVVPFIILPYYSLIGGWILKYLFSYLCGDSAVLAADGTFGGFISHPLQPMVWNLIFLSCNAYIILRGVEGGIEKISRLLMPALLVLAVIIAIYSVTRPGAWAGVEYYVIPDFSRFSIMTLVVACGQLFFSMSVGMAILISYGSYMRKEVDIEKAAGHVALLDTAVAILAGFMVIPAVFAFSGGDANALKAGAGLMFITIPKVFESMGLANVIGVAFFLMVFFAALTSCISIYEACVSNLCDRLGWSRKKASIVMFVEAIALGTPCALGFGPWESVQIAGLGILDMMDFLASSMLCPLAALLTCLLIGRLVGVQNIIDEVKRSSPFKRENIFRVCIVWIAPPLLLVVFVSSVLAALGFLEI